MTLSKVKGLKTHFLKLKDQKHTFFKVKGPKTYLSLIDQNNIPHLKIWPALNMRQVRDHISKDFNIYIYNLNYDLLCCYNK